MINRQFFRRDPIHCARELIGCSLAAGGAQGIIVETEAYDAEDDPACHTAARPSARAFVAANPPGTAYVYLNYGVHWLFNILVKGDRLGFVLVRALEPIGAGAVFRARRGVHNPPQAWCSGPGKLTRALAIDGTHHGVDLLAAESPISLGPRLRSPGIVCGPRIGISSAQEFPWRFAEKGSAFLSRPI